MPTPTQEEIDVRVQEFAVAFVKDRDNESFEALAAAIEPRVMRTLLWKLRNVREAEETFQDVLIKVWAHAPTRYDSSLGSFRRWVATIAIHTANTGLKQRQRAQRLHVPIDGIAESLLDEASSPLSDLESRGEAAQFKLFCEQQRNGKEIYAAIREHSRGETTWEETSDSVGWPGTPNSLKMAASRMRKRYRKMLSNSATALHLHRRRGDDEQSRKQLFQGR